MLYCLYAVRLKSWHQDLRTGFSAKLCLVMGDVHAAVVAFVLAHAIVQLQCGAKR
jgi:hypothetical protein